MSIHFTAKIVDPKTGVLTLNWCKMGLKPDLIDALRTAGMVPKQNADETIELMHENIKHQATILQLQDELFDKHEITNDK